ncbi:MAG: class I SAM-dependent methyltransferase [Candidatus Dormibacteria bacterium]
MAPEGEAFRPSADLFGHTSGLIVRCTNCGHGSLLEPPPLDSVMTAYSDAEDPVSIREEGGQVETAARALARVERLVDKGTAVDLGCWTGSFLVAARDRGWQTVGIEPSTWASSRARERGLTVHQRDLFEHGLPPHSARLVILCDVLEHLIEPRRALRLIHELLEPGGALYMTVPNAGSRLARVLGRRWWSVLPMHLQYFTPQSMSLAVRSEGFLVSDMASHAKAFTARYYAERLGGYSSTLERLAVGAVSRSGLADRMVAPDFRDRLQVVAVAGEHGKVVET